MQRPHMRRVKGKNTGPELQVRKLLWDMGFRGYRIHYDKLPGAPDIAFTKHRKAIFVHGCFWHGHNCRAGRNVPRTNQDYWKPKLMRNVERDQRQRQALQNFGWETLVIWECELRDHDHVRRKLRRFLQGTTGGKHPL